MEKDFKRFEEGAELLKVLAHPVRLCIVNGLLKNGGCNVSKMQGCLDMPQSTISQHIQKLRSAGIIEGERNGVEIVYRVVDKRVKYLIQIIEEETKC